jgi:hypothetical protein
LSWPAGLVAAQRLRENIDVFDFQPTADEMTAVAGLDRRESSLSFTHQDSRVLELLFTLTDRMEMPCNPYALPFAQLC